jgi:bacteriocin biosynthesis cyclodehydratase domain-containing protein
LSGTGSHPSKLSRSARFTMVSLSGNRLLCIAENETRVLDRAVYYDVLDQIPAQCDADQIVANLSQRYDELEIQAALAELETLGLVVRDAPAFSQARQAYWELQPVTGTAVSVAHLVPGGARTIREALVSHGMRITDNAPLLIVVTDDYLRPEVAQLAAHEGAWLLAKPTGHVIWLGPFFGAPGQVCWRCMATAIAANRWQQASLLELDGEAQPPEPSIAATPATIALAAGLIATAAAGWTAKAGFPVLENSIFTMDTRTLRNGANVLRPRPDCPVCAPLATNRVTALTDLVSPLTGIVSRLELTPAPVHGLYHARASYVHPLPATACRPSLRPMPSTGSGFSEWPQHETGSRDLSLERHGAVSAPAPADSGRALLSESGGRGLPRR